MTGRTLAALLCLLLSAASVRADEVVVRSGKAYRGFVRKQGREVILNEYGCSAEAMVLGSRRFRAIDVREIRPFPVPDHLQRELGELGPNDVDRRIDLMRQAQSARNKPWALRLAAEILRIRPTQAEALKVFGGAEKFKTARHGNPELDRGLALAIRRMLRIESGAERREEAARLLKDHGYEAGPDVVERMVRSLQQDRGLAPEVRLTLGAKDHPGAHYALFVPADYDPLEPRPLLIALHGGGIMQAERSAVRGSPKDALALYLDDAKRLGWFLLCPQAIEAPWGTSKNMALLESTLTEIEALWNIDRERIHLAGQGGGADGAWHWANRKADRFASVSIASGGKPVGYAAIATKTALWMYHGDADEVVPIEPIRKAASKLLKKKAEFVYCELPREAHGLAPAARRDMFRYIEPKRRRRARKAWPSSAFARPSSPKVIAAFGDPVAAWGLGLSKELDGPSLVALLAAGRTDAEHAARRLLAEYTAARDELSASVRALVREREKPRAGRIWAAWLCGRWRDPKAVNELGDVLRASKDTRLLRYAAEAVGRIGSEDSAQDLRWALSDVSARYRALKGKKVAFQDFDRVCRLGAAVVEAVGLCVKNGEEFFPEMEESLVRFLLMDRRPIVFAAQNGENPSEPRAALAEALARAYRRLGAEKTLFDMLRASVRGDKLASQAVIRGMRRPGR